MNKMSSSVRVESGSRPLVKRKKPLMPLKNLKILKVKQKNLNADLAIVSSPKEATSSGMQSER